MTNERLSAEIEILRVGQLGEGVGEDGEGNVYFVPGAVPGDRIRLAYAATGKRYREGELLEVVRPSTERRESPCRHFGACGGCDWLHWDDGAQAAAKDAMIRHAVSRTGFEPVKISPFVAAGVTLGYRGRVQVRREGNKLGFIRRRSSEIVDVDSCAVAHPALNAEIARLREEAPEASRQKIELAVQADGSVDRWVDAPHGAGGFTQIHQEQNERLRELVAEKVRDAGARRVFELFCGNGNLTFAFAPHVQSVMAVDSSLPAIEAARNVRAPGDEKRLAFFHASVDQHLLRKMPPDLKGQYDTLILDPPRAGIGPCLEKFLHPKLENVIFVACSLVSFSKDIQCLRKDYRLVDVQGIDMFPQTRHVECVARFERLPS